MIRLLRTALKENGPSAKMIHFNSLQCTGLEYEGGEKQNISIYDAFFVPHCGDGGGCGCVGLPRRGPLIAPFFRSFMEHRGRGARRFLALPMTDGNWRRAGRPAEESQESRQRSPRTDDGRTVRGRQRRIRRRRTEDGRGRNSKSSPSPTD